MTADLRAGKFTCHVDVEAPREGRATTRVNWLVRQLKNAPDGTRVEAFVTHARGSQAAELLSTVRENPASLILDPTKELRSFRLAVTGPLGTKRGRGRGTFIDSVLSSVDGFYGEVLGTLRAWSAAPPRLRPVPVEPPELDSTVPAALASTDYSSQDGAEQVGPEGEQQMSAPEPPTGSVREGRFRTDAEDGHPPTDGDLVQLNGHQTPAPQSNHRL